MWRLLIRAGRIVSTKRTYIKNKSDFELAGQKKIFAGYKWLAGLCLDHTGANDTAQLFSQVVNVIMLFSSIIYRTTDLFFFSFRFSC